MNILLTGSNGFLGNYFIKDYNLKYNIDTFSFLNNDFEKLDLNGINTVVHLSALVHQMGGASAEEYERVNVTQTLELAKKAKASGVGHFIFMSTVKVYGEEADIAYTEDSVCNPEDEYGKSKLRAEKELQSLEEDDFIVSIIRTPIVYGYGVKANIKNLVSLVKKVPVLPFGKIDNKRSMVYIGNLCHLIDAVIRFPVKLRMTDVDELKMTDTRHPRARPGDLSVDKNIFLASDNEPISTTRLIELIAKELDRKVYLVKVPFFESLLKLVKPDFHKRLYGSLEVDNTLTINRLFGEAKATLPYSVEDGIEFMIKGELDPQVEPEDDGRERQT